eukprot:TRINITY_DN4016_c0_g2_i2.p1 TRINITY_DN4016_c0_g2~~TRINITY_DN4016_c0_g2_i2.p1  ORF type:complete len:566 (+),score=63.03 TRINITY_DN4016_c0_g2_i2:120-1700(+)
MSNQKIFSPSSYLNLIRRYTTAHKLQSLQTESTRQYETQAVLQEETIKELARKRHQRKIGNVEWAKMHNSAISRAQSFKKLFIIVDENGRRFDHINIATALTQAARLFQGEDQHEVEQLMLLLCRDFTPKMVQKMQTWSLSNCLWALAKTGFHKHEVGMKSVKTAIMEINAKISSLKGADLSNIVWAMQQIGLRDVKFLDNLATMTVIQAEQLQPRALCALALSFAKLNYYSAELFHVLQENCVHKMNNFNGQMIGNSVCAFSHTRYKSDLFLVKVCEKLQDLDTGAITLDVRCLDQVIRGFTIFNFAHDETIIRLRDNLLKSEELDFLALSNMLYSLGLLGYGLDDAEPVLSVIRAGFQQMGIISFNEVTQFQIFCATLLFATRGIIVSLPPDLLHSAREISVRSVRNQPLLQEMAVCQMHVQKNLERMGFKVVEGFIAGEYVVIDLAMKVKGQNVAVFVNGPECYTMSMPPERLGSLVARYMVAIGQGFRVVEVPYFEWDMLNDDSDREVYLHHKLATQIELPS